MITVEDLLMAYAVAYDVWLDPEAERKNPTPEYAELIRQAVSSENAELRDLVRDMWREGAFEPGAYCVTEAYGLAERTRELGIEVAYE